MTNKGQRKAAQPLGPVGRGLVKGRFPPELGTLAGFSLLGAVTPGSWLWLGEDRDPEACRGDRALERRLQRFCVGLKYF